MGIIYKITSPSGKAYIGKTEGTLQHRITIHKGPGSKCPAIRRAFAKYGEERMKVEVLKSVQDQDLDYWEVRLIREHGTYGPGGYNLTPGGEAIPLKCPEVVAKMKATMARPEVKAKLSMAQKHNHAKPGAREKRSKALKAAHARPETKQVVKAAWKIAQNRHDVKQKQRVAQRKAHKDPAIHAARMAGLKRSQQDPEAQARRAAAIKAAWARRKANLSNGTITSLIKPYKRADGTQVGKPSASKMPMRPDSPSLTYELTGSQ